MDQRFKNVLIDATLGAAFGFVVACRRNHDGRTGAVLGAGLGVFGFGMLRNKYRRGSLLAAGSRSFVGWLPPPHPIDVQPNFDPSASHAQQARSVLLDFAHDDNLRNWFDKGEVTAAFGVHHKEDYDPNSLVAAYENKRDPVWAHLGQHQETSWNELAKNVDLAIGKRKKLGKLPKASYDRDPIVVYYYDDTFMKRVEYPKGVMPAMLNPENHYYWRDPNVHTAQTQDPNKIRAEQLKPGLPGNLAGWDSEGFAWDKDVAGQIGQITSTTLQLIGVAMSATGYLAAAGSLVEKAAPFIGAALGMVDDAFQGNDNSKAALALAGAVLQLANAGVGQATGVTMPKVAMEALSGVLKGVAASIAAGQNQHLDFTGIWSKVLNKAKSFGKMGDQQAHTLSKILGENSAGSTFLRGYQAGKLSDLPTIQAISQLFNNSANGNVFMLGAGLGQLAVHQGSAARHS